MPTNYQMLPPGLQGYVMQQDRMRQEDMGQLQQVAQTLQIRNAMQQQAAQQRAQQEQAAYQTELQNAPDDATRQAIMRRRLSQTNPEKVFEIDEREKARKEAATQRAQQFAETLALRQQALEDRKEAFNQRTADAAARAEFDQWYKGQQLVLQQQQQLLNAEMKKLGLELQKQVNDIRADAANNKPITEFQGKNALYGSRAAMSDQVLNNLEEKISLVGLSTKETLQNTPVIGGALGAAANVALSPDQQKVEQAQRNFVNAVLRQESGAVISNQEFDNAKKQYFPQPGDSKEVIAQKRANRKAAIEGFKRIAGPAWASVEEQLGQSAIPSAPSASSAPKVIDFGSLK